MAKGSRMGGSPRKTTLKGHSAMPAQKGAAKPNVLVRGKGGSTGH